MERGIKQWSARDPQKMAQTLSGAAVYYALQDAKRDILALHRLAMRVASLNPEAGEICKPWAAHAAIHAAKHLRVKCGSFAARRYAEKRGASALMYQIAEEFEEKRSRKCK